MGGEICGVVGELQACNFHSWKKKINTVMLSNKNFLILRKVSNYKPFAPDIYFFQVKSRVRFPNVLYLFLRLHFFSEHYQLLRESY